MRAALALYGGELLEGMERADRFLWVHLERRREQFQDAWARAAERLAALLLDDGQPTQAWEALRPVFEVSLWEPAWQRALEAQAGAQGSPSVYKIVRRLEARLREDLGIDAQPTAETYALADRLLKRVSGAA